MSLDPVLSVVHIAAGFALSVALGFGPAYGLLPGALRRHALLVAPGAGYAAYCLVTIAVSVNLGLPVNTALWIALAVLAAASAVAFAAARRREELRGMWAGARPAALATLLMAAVMFWPVVWQGTTLYLGTANIDFYQSLAYQEVLARYDLAALDPRPAVDYSLDPFFGTFPDPVPAKFGGVMFALLLQKALFLEPRAALMTAVVVFLLALPAATSLFAKTALDMGDRVAGVSAGLIAVSAPVAMSFIHVLVGQNSSLALLPLALAVCYLAVRSRDWRVLALALVLLDAVLWMYVAILPYIGAPVGLFALYDLARNRRGALRWAATAAGILAGGFIVVQLGMERETRQLVDDMVSLLGRANRVVYVDFLTELSLPHSLGLTSYPVTSSVYLAHAPTSTWVALAAGFVAAAFVVLAFYFRSFVAWARRAAPEPRAFAIAALVVYLAVWCHFNFIALYGYAIFKMASWLQFFFVPFVAYGLVHFASQRGRGGPLARFDAAFAVIVGGLAVAANVVATFEFGVKGLGDDTRRGSIVNSYGIGGNRDYLQLERDLARVLPAHSVVGIAMPDFIANLWTTYYVQRAGMRASLVSHDDFPDEDAALPDVHTRRVVNSAGQSLVYKPRYHADRPPHLLLEGPANLNREITDQKAEAPPLWSNGTFVLVETARMRDALVTARGFYRLEYFDRERFSWWWPERMRWSAQGGEFLLLNASRPGEPHRLSFVAVAGVQREMPRHLEIWLNGKLVDEVTVRGAARVVSKPFHPTGGFDMLVVRSRERVSPTPRNFGLWNRHIAIDQRQLNLLFAQARILREGERGEAVGAGTLAGKDIIDRSVEFNGLSMDGWASPDTRIVLPVAAGTARARLQVEVPGWAGYTFPLRVAVTTNGVTRRHELARAGAHELECDLAAGADKLDLRIESAQSTSVPGVGTATFLLRSVRLE